jgi:teichuronic acid biosynthesis glycosyltransferase TuaC
MTASPLWLAPSYPCDADIYAAIWLRTQAHAMKKIGMTPNVIAPVPWVPPGFTFFSNKWDRYIGAPYREDDEGIEIFRPRYFSHPREHKFGAPHLMQLIRLMYETIKKPSVIHAHFALQQGWVGLHLAKRWKVPLVVSLLGDDVNVYPHFSEGDMQRFKAVIAGADVVISQGSALDDATEAITGRRPRTLPLGVNLERFTRKNDKAEARTNLELPQDKSIILFVGSLVDHKGIPELLSCIESLFARNIFAVFIGEGPLRNQIIAMPNTLTVGSLDQDSVKSYVEVADLAVLPSHREGLPLTLVEAGALGVPVVASDVGSIKDLIGDERGWLVPAHDEASLRSAIDQALGDPQEAARRGDRLQNHVINHFSDTVYATELSKIYATLIR